MHVKYILTIISGIILLVAIIYSQDAKKMKYNKLTPEEERVILHKGTERPFTGKYTEFKGNGIYVCKRCDAPLYTSDDKFDSHCGWPSFDDEIEGAVKRVPDADGRRTEIICNNCGAHLGHVFLNEGFTDKNTRHCVNSISLKFIPKEEKTTMDKSTELATFAGGCFWGVEYYFQKQDGVLSTTVGYTGGFIDNPTYKEVCNGKTGHVEAIEVEFDPTKVSYEELAKLFFDIHDPTQVDRQGPDVGYQYRSMVFFHNEKQKSIAEKLIKILESKGYDVVTEVVKADKFWPAEDYHQEYYEHNGKQPYCHVYKDKF
ncbi:MAG: bifunctional methionine sulfoxide reductase B/A protein [Calditrichaceae bacterium]